MRRVDQVAGLLLLVFGLWYGAVAVLRYPYWSSTGPGSGFLPVWLGGVMAVLASLLVVKARHEPSGSALAWLPRGQGLARLLAVLVATALFVALMRSLGMGVTTVLFLFTLLRFVEGYSWLTAGAIAAGVTLANFLVFSYWLHVPFPTGVFGF